MKCIRSTLASSLDCVVSKLELLISGSSSGVYNIYTARD